MRGLIAPSALILALGSPAVHAQEAPAAPLTDAPARINAVAAPLPEADCGALSSMDLAATGSSFLSDRFQMTLPAGAEHASVPNDIMAAAVPEDTSSLYFLTQGEDRLGIVANETFQVVGPDFDAAVHRYLTDLPPDGAPWNIAPLPLADPAMKAIAYWPSTLVVSGDSDVWALGVLYGMPDGGVAHVSFRLDTLTAAHGSGCTGYAAKLASTAIHGDRALSRAARDERVAVSATRTLKVHVPADVVMLPQPGPDFQVIYLIPLVPLDQPSPSLGVYIGAYPQDLEASNLPDVPGTLLGEQGSWSASEAVSMDGAFRALRLERRIEVAPEGKKKKKKKKDAEDPTASPLYVHVFMSATDEAQLTALKAIAESLSWEKVK